MTGRLKKGTRPWARHVLSDMSPLREEYAYLEAGGKTQQGRSNLGGKEVFGENETNLTGPFSCVRLFMSADLV